MLRVSVQQFRVVCVVALVSLVLFQLPTLGLLTFSKGVTALRAYKFYEALAPAWVLWVYSIVESILLVVGLVGMLNFWRLSRWCVVATFVIALVLHPFLGLSVYSTYEAFLATAFGLASSWLMTISFWSPLAERFKAHSNVQIVP